MGAARGSLDLTTRLEAAATELLRRRRARESLVGFAEGIEIPGAPLGDDEAEAVAFRPVAAAGEGLASVHRLLLARIERCMLTRYGRLMILMPPGCAKALALDTPIATPTGWTQMGRLKVGDQVFDERGHPCNVTWVSPVWKNRPAYRVTTDCGDSIIADRDHEWRVRLCGKRDVYKIKETWELDRRRAKRPMIERSGVLELPDAELPLDPYLLGVWLGDGTSAAGEFTACDEDARFYRAEFDRAGYETRDRAAAMRFAVADIRGRLVDLGVLSNKHIPARYLRSSATQRLALLQGLVDTDGTVSKKSGMVTFCSTNPRIASGVMELARSLGVKASVGVTRATLKGRDCGAVWRVNFYHPQAARLPRKAALCRANGRTPNTYIDVEPAGTADTVCIEVDSPSHLFLCGASMTPTHNSTYASVVAPTWFMGKFPGTRIMLASYGTELAKKHGSKARHIVRSGLYQSIFGARLERETSAKEMWAINFDAKAPRSEYMSGGLLSGLTGNRANGIIVDDPFKGRDEAKSPTIRERTWDAYNFDLATRALPGAWKILINTRWDDDDISGRLLPKEYAGESGRFLCNDGMWWDVLCLPAEAEREDDPLGREKGQMIWPEYYDREHWDQFRVDPILWASLYQQRPRPNGGKMIDTEKVKRYTTGHHPKWLNRFVTSDFATRHEDGDFTWHIAWGVDQDGALWMLGGYAEQVRTDVGAGALLDVCQLYKARLAIGEKGVIWNSIEPMVEHVVKTRRTGDRNYRAPRFKMLPSVASKTVRALTFQGLVEQGKVYIPYGPLGEKLMDELREFPSDRIHDDGVDCCSLAGRAIMEPGWAREIPEEVVDVGLVPYSVKWLEYEPEKPSSEGRYV